ncbi:unnamed protein product [Scytosiphon promiscuus]
MSKCIKVDSRVYKGIGDSAAAVEDRLRFDPDCRIVTVGRTTIKLSELKEPPIQSADGNLELVSKKLRVVTASTPASRDLMAAVGAAARRDGGGGGGGSGGFGRHDDDDDGDDGAVIYQPGASATVPRRKIGNGSINLTANAGGNKKKKTTASRTPSHATAPRTGAFNPTNTLNRVSRVPARAGHAGGGNNFGGGTKRGRMMAAVGGGSGRGTNGRARPPPPPRLPRNKAAMEARSSGPVTSRRAPGDVLEVDGPRGTADGVDDEELSDVNENSGKNDSGNGTSGGGSSSGSRSGNPNCIRSYCSSGTSDSSATRSGDESWKSGGGGYGGKRGDRHGGWHPGNAHWKKPSGIRKTYGSGGGRSWAAGSGRYPPLLLSSQSAAAEMDTRGGIRDRRRGEGPLTQYMRYSEPMSRREGFRNMGNTCYLNACLQGLLSLSGFVGDLRRECWVLAMLKPTAEAGAPKTIAAAKLGDAAGVVGSGGGVGEAAIDVRDSPCPRPTTAAAAATGGGGSGGGGGRKPSLYDALLRLSLEAAKGSHGVMDASPLKSAMDGHSDRFAGNLQQDAHEFLNDLINVLHEETQPRLEAAAGYVTRATTVIDLDDTAGGGDGGGKTPARAGRKAGTNSGLALKGGGTVDNGGGGGRGGGGVTTVDLSSAWSGDEKDLRGQGDDAYDGGWDSSDGFAAAAAAAADATPSTAAVAGGLAAGARIVEVDSDTGCSDGDGASANTAVTVSSSGLRAKKKGLEGEREEDEERRKAEEEEEEALRERERLMPTTRHFHAEVEVTLTCTRCSYSRWRRELYRDFSLDIPDSAPPPPPSHRTGEGGSRTTVGGEGGSKGPGGGVFGLETLLEGFFQPAELNLRCERCGHDQVRAEHSLAELPGALILHVKRFKPVLTSSPKAAPKPKPKVAPLHDSASPPEVRPRRPTCIAATATAAAAGVVDISQEAGGGPAATDVAATDVAGDVDGGITPPPAAVVGGGSTGESGRSSGGEVDSRGGGLRSYGGVSYVKLRTPVAVPLALDLERFCTEYTGNAPSETLGKGVDSLEGLGIPKPSSSSSSSAGTGPGVRPTPRTSATAAAKGGGGGGGGDGGRRRPSGDGVSVDLSMREGWSSDGASAAAAVAGRAGGDNWRSGGGGGDENASNKRSRGSGGGVGGGGEFGGGDGNDEHDPFEMPSLLETVPEEDEGRGTGSDGISSNDHSSGGVGARSALGIGSSGVKRKAEAAGGGIGALWDATNRRTTGGSRGVRETATERRRRVAKEKENGAPASGQDRWTKQDKTSTHPNLHSNTNRKLQNGVPLGADGQVDYLSAISSNTSQRNGNCFPTSSPTGRGETPRGIFSRGMPGWELLRGGLGAAEVTSGAVLAEREKRKRKWKEKQEQEKRELDAAIANSQREAFGPGFTAEADEEAELARAISLSQEEGILKMSLGSGRAAVAESPWSVATAAAAAAGSSGGGSGIDGLEASWACSSCTLINEKGPGFDVCEACGAPREEPAPTSSPPAVGDCAATVNAAVADGGRGHGREGAGREKEEEELVVVGDDGLPEAAGGTRPPSSRGGGDKQPQPDERKQDRDGRGEEDSPHTPEPEPEPEPEPQPERSPRKGPLRARYELRGILHHLGQHAFAGHYVTDVRGEERGESSSRDSGGGGGGTGALSKEGGWKRFDDSVVTSVAESRALEGAAQRTCYICFYSLAEQK